MDIISKIKGLSYIGWRNILASLRYSCRLSTLERAARRERPSDTPVVTPGQPVEFEARSDGALCVFGALRLEICFLAPDLVRLTWQPGVLPVPYAIARQEWPPVPVTSRESEGGWNLASGELQIDIVRDGGIRFADAAGRTLREDLPPARQGERWISRARLHPNEHYFGLGERTAPLELRGHQGSAHHPREEPNPNLGERTAAPGNGIRRYRFWNREPKGQYGPGDDPIYLGIPVYLSLSTHGSSLVFFENSHDGTMAFGDEVRTEFEGGVLRYYVACGPLSRLVERFTELTGRPALPPRWSLGFHQSRWSYTNEGEVRDLVRGFQEHQLPLGAVHLDIHYMDGYRVFTVDKQRFPDLPALTASLAQQGIRTVMILDPGVKKDPGYLVYEEGMKNGSFCRLPNGEPVVAPVWPGNCLFPDFTDPEVRRWWGDHYQALIDWGADGIWHDMNEPAAFTAWGATTLPSTTRHCLDGRGASHLEAHNLYGLLEARAGFEGLSRLRPDRRPWILSRSGWVGLQRYGWTWTGDCETDWWSLTQSLRMALSLGLCGIPYSGPDIGGFSGSPDAELFIRWFELASFLPFFRIHSAGFTPRREPWTMGDRVLSAVRKYLELRYRLLPYLYTLAYQASQTGHPLVRPFFWETPESPDTWDVDDTFFLGPSLLVAPVLVQGMTGREVPLPGGDWYDFWYNQRFSGPTRVTVDLPLDRIGLFVRQGTILPLEEDGGIVLHLYAPSEARDLPPRRYGVGEVSAEPTKGSDVPGTERAVLSVPLAREAEEGSGVRAPAGMLYRDAGDGYGPSRLDRFLVRRAGDRLLVERRTEGSFEPVGAPMRLALHGALARCARVDGEERAVEQDRIVVGEFERIEFELG